MCVLSWVELNMRPFMGRWPFTLRIALRDVTVPKASLNRTERLFTIRAPAITAHVLPSGVPGDRTQLSAYA